MQERLNRSIRCRLARPLTPLNFAALRQEVCKISAVENLRSCKSGPKFTKIGEDLRRTNAPHHVKFITFGQTTYEKSVAQNSARPPTNTWSLGPIRVHKPNGISIGSAVFARLTTVTDIPTSRLVFTARLCPQFRTPPVPNAPELRSLHVVASPV